MEHIGQQIRSIVGEENLIIEPDELNSYTQDNISFIAPRLPLMAAKPGNVEELTALVRLAGLTQTPLTPKSSSHTGHGGSIPSVPGITVDLRRLNKILLIDPISRNAIIESGVTFAELQAAANEQGLRVLTPIDLPADSSVLSTYLEMTPLYAWPKYGTENILSLEFILPTGETIKTGSASIPVFNEKPYMPLTTVPAYLEKVWYGAQGTLGIATQAVVKLKTDYAQRKVLFASFASLPASLSAIKAIARMDHPSEFFAANATSLAALLARDEAEFDSLKKKLPQATLVLVLRGEPERVDYQQADLADLAQEMGFEFTESVADLEDAPERVLSEIHLPQGISRYAQFKGAYHTIPFICMAMQVPMFSGFLPRMSQAFGCSADDVGEFLLPVEPTRFHFEYSFFSNPQVVEEHFKVQKLFETWSSTLIKMGAFFSRPYGPWASQLFAKATAYKELLKEFKDTIDPQHIMNPGKLDL